MRFLILLAFLGFVLFYNSTIDFFWAGLFYTPGVQNPWPHEFDLLWRFFYFAAPAIVFLFCLPALVLFVGSFFKESWLRWRRKSLFVLLSLLLGPGLLINTVFKPNWGRPRPRQVIEYGGVHSYQQFWKLPEAKRGMSFPCGHCSVGFLLMSLSYLLYDKKRKSAQLIFAMSVGIGLLMGVGRIAAGAHFMSDVFWAGWMTALSIHVSYFYILKLHLPEPVLKTNPRLGFVLGGVMLSLSLAGPLLATPFQKSVKQQWQVEKLAIEIDKGDVEVIEIPGIQEVRLEGEVKGFGLPMSQIIENQENEKFKIVRKGVFTEVEARYRLYLTKDLNDFSLHITRGGKIIGPQISERYKFIQEKF